MSPKDLLARIDAHLARTGESPSAFGRRAVNDHKVVAGIRAGRQVRFDAEQKILAAIRKHRRRVASAPVPAQE